MYIYFIPTWIGREEQENAHVTYLFFSPISVFANDLLRKISYCVRSGTPKVSSEQLTELGNKTRLTYYINRKWYLYAT